MYKKLITICLLVAFSLPLWAQLRVSDNKRFLVTKDGKPFFWLGDTAWELFHRLSREEADKYLANRAEKGFTVIQAVILAELDGLRVPNAYGEIPLEDFDPTRPREAYFQHVDYIINKAATLGIYIALLPTWGDKVFKDRWGEGPEIFNTANAAVYGKWLGNRYKSKTNIIWVMGGDRVPDEKATAIWRSLAAGIATGTGGNDNALMTFHPQPNGVEDGGSSKYFHNDEWLDFNMLQTGHCRENNIWDRIQVVYNRAPFKPVLDGEPLYEDHPVCFNAKDLGISSAYDVRKHAYLDLFAGAFGHTYGCHDVWQMYAPNRTSINGAHLPWYIAIDLPGAGQMRYVRKLLESRSMIDRVPDQTLITDALGNNDRIQATRGKDYIFIYSSEGRSFTVKMGKVSGDEITSTWFNPRNGEEKNIGRSSNKGEKVFNPPTSGYGQDWVLIIDEASKIAEKR
jgi:uncharacterized protein DUF4038/collagenase-like protein with putative collagen-binding domain